jgi:hypothetical protein
LRQRLLGIFGCHFAVGRDWTVVVVLVCEKHKGYTPFLPTDVLVSVPPLFFKNNTVNACLPACPLTYYKRFVSFPILVEGKLVIVRSSKQQTALRFEKEATRVALPNIQSILT